MKAIINGLEVHGTPEEIEQYRIISQSRTTHTHRIHIEVPQDQDSVNGIIQKFFKDTSHIWE